MDRQNTQLLPLEANMNSYIAITNEFISNITTGDVFSGDLIQNNVRLGSKPQSIRVSLYLTRIALILNSARQRFYCCRNLAAARDAEWKLVMSS